MILGTKVEPCRLASSIKKSLNFLTECSSCSKTWPEPPITDSSRISSSSPSMLSIDFIRVYMVYLKFTKHNFIQSNYCLGFSKSLVIFIVWLFPVFRWPILCSLDFFYGLIFQSEVFKHISSYVNLLDLVKHLAFLLLWVKITASVRTQSSILIFMNLSTPFRVPL